MNTNFDKYFNCNVKILLLVLLLILNIGCGNQEKQSKKSKNETNSILPIKITKKDHKQIIDVYNMDITVDVKVNEKKANGDSWDIIGDPDIAGIIAIHKIIYNGEKYKYNYKKNFRTVTSLSIGDLISFEFWDEDPGVNDVIGKNEIIFNGQRHIKLPLIYEGKTQGYVRVEIKPNEIIMNTYIDDKQFTKKQLQFENNKLNWLKVRNYILADESSKIIELEDKIRKYNEKIHNTSDQSEKNYLKERIRIMREKIKTLKNPFRSRATRTYSLNDWICKLNNIYNNDNDIICDCIAGHLYIIHIPLNDTIIKRTVPFFNRGDLIKFNGNLNNVYFFKEDYPIWNVKITSLDNEDANNRLIKLIKLINEYEKYIADVTNKIKSTYNILINKYPKLKDKHSQNDFEKALIYYYKDKEFTKKLNNDLILISEKINNFKEAINKIIQTSSPYKYSLKEINLPDLNVDNIVNFRKNYFTQLSKFRPDEWTGKIIKVTKEKEKEIKTDWGKIAQNLTLLILSRAASKMADVDLSDVVEDSALDHKITKETTIDVYYVYLEHNGLIWKIRINDKDKNKLFAKEYGDQLYFSGKLQTIDNKGIIYVNANSFH